MKHSSRNDNRQPELFWPRLVMRKWLNISAKDSDYSADTEDDDDIFSDDANINTEEMCKWPRESRLKDNYSSQIQNDLDDGLPRMRRRKSETFRAQYINSKEIRICAGTWNVGGKLPPEDQDIEGWLDIGDPADIYVIGFQEIIPLNAGNIFGAEDSRPVSKWENIIRETLNKIRPTKTKFKCYSDPPSPSRFKPSDDIPEIEDELLLETDSEDEKEMHPLNEEFMEFDEARDELLPSLSSDDANLGVPVERDLKKQFSSPNKLDRLNCLRTEECTGNELLLETDSEDEEEIHPLNEESMEFDEARDEILTSLSSDDAKFGVPVERDLKKQFSSPKKLDRLNCLPTEECTGNADSSVYPQNRKLTKTLSASERIGLSWPEPPLHLLAQRVLERPNSLRSFQAYSSSKSFRSFKDSKSFQAYRSSKSFQAYSSFKSYTNGNNRVQSDAALLAELDLEALMYRKKRPPFVRIVSKQMVGVFLTVWVRRSLRRHIQNLKVSTVGVGVMGYIGNKGSISVSMSIYQTLFCFICTHLTSGEKDADTVKRNADVNEIHRRTHFHSGSSIGLPKRIHDHERIIWLGDLNYRINLSYEKTRQLISRKDWSKLVESDQLIRELRKGRAFDGWSEGVLKFPPTYKYELNSDKYCGEDPKAGRRIPAWCDRILSFGKGMRLLNYRRSELRLSDHRPVTASFMVEVEVFSPRKLQRALTFTDAEIEDEEAVADMGIDVGMSRLRAGEDINDWDR